jgi:predicted ester cyclase
MPAPSTSEELQRIVEGAWGAVASNDWEALDEFFAPDYVRHTGASSLSLADLKQLLKAEHAAFPDTEIELCDFIAGGDRIAFRWASSATHLGTYLGVPPTHRRVSVSGITVSRISDAETFEREPLLYLRGAFFDGGHLDPAP